VENHKKIKLAAFDLDGTLLNSEKKISEENKNAIEAAIKKGVHVVPATGRTNKGIPKELLAIEGIRYAICANGASIVDLKEGKVLHKQYLSLQLIEEIMSQIGKYDLIIDILSDGKIISEERNQKRIYSFLIPENMHSYVLSTRTWVKDVMEYANNNGDKLEKINLFFQTIEQRSEVKEVLSQNEQIVITSSLDTNLEINQVNANKGTGLSWLSKYLGLSIEEVMACGDSENDLEMMNTAGLSVAMGNGNRDVKDAADVITLTNDENGVASAINRYILDDSLSE